MGWVLIEVKRWDILLVCLWSASTVTIFVNFAVSLFIIELRWPCLSDTVSNLRGVLRICACCFLLTFLLGKSLSPWSIIWWQVPVIGGIPHIVLLLVKFDWQGHVFILVTMIKGPHELVWRFISLDLILCIQNLFDLFVLVVGHLLILYKLLRMVRYLVFVRSVNVCISLTRVGRSCCLPLICCRFVSPGKDYLAWLSRWGETFLWCTSILIG